MKKKILFVNDEMVLGGVARILNTLMAALDKDKYEVDLLILHKHGEMLNEIPKGVNVLSGTSFFSVIDLPIKQIIKDFDLISLLKKIRLIFYMKTGLIKNKIIKERHKILNQKYDVEFSAKEGFCTIFTAYGDTPRKLNWVQLDYKVQNNSSKHMNLVKDALSHIDVNIACSNQARDSFKEVFNIDNVITIHNLIDVKKIKKLMDEPLLDNIFDDNYLNLIAVARFHPQKSLDRLIHAVKYITDKGIKAKLILIGGGELEDELKNLVFQLELNDLVYFLGYKSNPYNYIKHSNLFVLSSLYEGFPTIVLESLISTTPVLALDVAGVSEQITAPNYGYIVPNNQDSLNTKLYEVAQNKKELQSMKTSLQNYGYYNDLIMQQLEKEMEGK